MEKSGACVPSQAGSHDKAFVVNAPVAQNEHDCTEVAGVEQLWLCLCRPQYIYGTCFGTGLHYISACSNNLLS